MDGILTQIDVSAILAVVAGIFIGVSVTWIAVWFINRAKVKTFQDGL